MITKLIIRNFKKFGEVEIELGHPVVFIGPNNSGKTSALQALTLWETGYKKWIDKRGTDNEKSPKERPGITINRTELNSIPINETKLLWKDTHAFLKQTKVFIDIIVEGENAGKTWQSGFEFYFANDESFYCRPIRLSGEKSPSRMPVTSIPNDIKIAFLHPMSGLSDKEFLKQPGEIDFLLGQGQTAQVLRNLCFAVFKNFPHQWEEVVKNIKDLFGVEILKPGYSDRSEITIQYKDINKVILDLPAAGRGLQQTLLLLVYLFANPNSILLLDEPDAHLEILRQRQIFNRITQIASDQNTQIIAASHSEVVLNETAETGTVIAFVGRPHVLNDRGSQLLKSLTTIGFDQYYQAEQKGWVLYLEGATDLAMLLAFAEKLDHPVKSHLGMPFVHYVSTNIPQKAREHFYGIAEAKKDLVGISIFDHIEQVMKSEFPLVETMWQKRELENYFCTREVLLGFTEEGIETAGPLFFESEKKRRHDAMSQSIDEIEKALTTLGKTPWSDEIKASDDFFQYVFREYSAKLSIALALKKKDYHKLIKYLSVKEIDPEIVKKLDLIQEVIEKACPLDVKI
jgi:energy-coupling factor transporter ATP-binding protein EcfA2